MTPSTVLSANGLPKFSLGRLTLSIFAVTGVILALAEWGVVPRAALLVATPAVIATLLVDTFLYNEFLIRTGAGFWVILAGFVFVQSLVAAAVLTRLSRFWSRGRPRIASE
ncbi:hypothetical protein NGM10_06080 [Halorussus salilacus]|uniref:hypothetical protein n=1 Tax=Halorussus salilacus TaxID=2953750 RepID=UPI0020A1B8BA|nr:hypothetical protein [Halorussus salilacus]USZ69302.1 hypothetical protein NGM10_06080 [Halorussus salilacus]